jgi:hypothetical protein
MYSYGRDKTSKLMNRFLHEVLDLTPAIILTVLFSSLLHFTVGGINPKNYSTFHYGIEIGKIKRMSVLLI